MNHPVFVVSEWLPKEGHEQELWQCFKELLALTLKKEPGCKRAHVTRQMVHPGAPSKSKFKIVLLQEYENVQAFDMHCQSEYVAHFFKTYIENKETAIVAEWQCRLFSEAAGCF